MGRHKIYILLTLNRYLDAEKGRLLERYNNEETFDFNIDDFNTLSDVSFIQLHYVTNQNVLELHVCCLES